MYRQLVRTILLLCLSVHFGSCIFGGRKTKILQHPYQVSIRDDRIFAHICSGVLYKAKYVITAAQCVSKRPAENLILRAGSDDGKNGGVLRSVERIVVHPDYDWMTRENDLAILVLQENFPEIPEIASIAGITGPKDLRKTTGLIVTGWGLNEINDLQLRKLSVNLLPETVCNAVEEYTDTVFCAGDMNAKSGPCRGDNGGPLVGKVGREYYLVGLVSWNPIGCAVVNNPTYYTDVNRYSSWIMSEIQKPAESA